VYHVHHTPADPERTLQYQSAIDISAPDLATFAVAVLIENLQFVLEVGPGQMLALHLAEARVRLDGGAVAKQLWSEQRAVARHMTIRNTFVLKRNW
jgi:hypothetical protein